MEKNLDCCDKFLEDFDVDTVPGPPSLWMGGIHDATGARFIKFAGREIGCHKQFQFLESDYMKAEDYDDFIADPTKWILTTFLPRIHTNMKTCYRARLSLVKGTAGMVMNQGMQGAAVQRWAKKYGVFPSISGMSKAPFDTLGDVLRGCMGS